LPFTWPTIWPFFFAHDVTSAALPLMTGASELGHFLAVREEVEDAGLHVAGHVGDGQAHIEH
jgi:hypothetical protein